MSSMNFCDDCGKIMIVIKNGSLATAKCEVCDKKKLLSSGIVLTNKIVSPPAVSKEVADNVIEKIEAAFPHVCSKCGHNEAYVKDLGAFLSDESNVYLFKCAKCGYTDRQADGCSNN